MTKKQNKTIKERVRKILENDDGFLCLENKTAEQWHNMCSYYLNKIKDHETTNKHTIREYEMVKTDYNTNKKEYRKLYICEDCGKVFLKCKYDPELLKIKEFYQMCFYSGLSNLAEVGVREQLNFYQRELDPK